MNAKSARPARDQNKRSDRDQNQRPGRDPNHQRPGRDPNRVIVFDTTLRDGEQAPGFSMTPGDKVRMARQLDRLGVDIIEA
ncbi:MAG: hypothetical protein ACFCUQ_02125, partial [Kiloniellales bacterium]